MAVILLIVATAPKSIILGEEQEPHRYHDESMGDHVKSGGSATGCGNAEEESTRLVKDQQHNTTEQVHALLPAVVICFHEGHRKWGIRVHIGARGRARLVEGSGDSASQFLQRSLAVAFQHSNRPRCCVPPCLFYHFLCIDDLAPV